MFGLRFCARAFSSCGERGPLFIAVRGPLTIAASPVAEHRLQTRRLSSCGSRAQLLRGMRDLPRPGLEPVSPTLAGRFSTTAPPGKSPQTIFWYIVSFGRSISWAGCICWILKFGLIDYWVISTFLNLSCWTHLQSLSLTCRSFFGMWLSFIPSEYNLYCNSFFQWWFYIGMTHFRDKTVKLPSCECLAFHHLKLTLIQTLTPKGSHCHL